RARPHPGESHLFFQPLVDHNSRLVGFEALLRLPDGGDGYILPNEFIPLAEEIGVINEIGGLGVQKGRPTAVAGPPHLSISINLSPAEFFGATPISTIVRDAIAG